MAASEVSAEAEQPLSVYPNGGNEDHAATEAESSEEAACGSQNGMAGCQTDRFGFCGGHQYTDPTQYVAASFRYRVYKVSDRKLEFNFAL